MAATGSADGHQHLATNQVPSVQESGAVKEEMDAESMDAVSEAEEKVDVVQGSPPCPSEQLEEDASVAADKEMETKADMVPSPASVAPQSPSPSQSTSSSTDQTFMTVLFHGDEPEGTTVEGSMKEEEDVEKDNSVKGEDTEMDTTSDHKEDTTDTTSDLKEEMTDTTSDLKEEITDTDGNVDPDIESKDTQEDSEPRSCNLRVSTAADLDEMMDIGTVDQIEQEAQMKQDEEERDSSSRSPGISNTVSGAEEEDDIKPTILPLAQSEDQEEDVKVDIDMMQSSSSPLSVAATSTGTGSSSPVTTVNGMKVVKLSLPRLDTTGLGADQTVKCSPSPPLVKVKDEPEDEEYEQALNSSTSTASVKEEPNTTKDLKIGSVYSVTPATESHQLPVIHPSSSSHISCSNCKKTLVKGQTAFQRRGCTELFCSTLCLTTSLPSVKTTNKICINCQKVILRPQDIILAPDAKGTTKECCSQSCLTSFNYKRKASASKSAQPKGPQSLCSMCNRFCSSKHEVILSDNVHKLCSDACFSRFRSLRNLAMAGCANCGSYCHSKPLLLKMEGGNKTLCNATCLAKYKEKTMVTQPCTMCRTTRLLSETVDNKNNDDSVNLFCSSSCVMAFMVQTVSASGARVSCDNCAKNSMPAYHLAMSDTTIRNFCSLPCVMAFQEKFKKSPKQVNVFTKLPVGSSQIQSVTSTQPERDVSKEPPILDCGQCHRNINFKPEIIQIKDKMLFMCSVECCQEYKTANFVMSLCDYCKVEKITRDVKRIHKKDCYFCSDGCKLLFKHDLAKNWGKHCSSCVYCHCVSKKLVTAQYGGSTEEFCSEECRSKYTMLFCHVAKCDTCGSKGKLKQSLPLLGEVKYFCDLTCLLQFCCDKVATQGTVEDDTPIIANVVSLAGRPVENSNSSDQQNTRQTRSRTGSKSKNSTHTSIQTERAPPPPPHQKILKNKALLCRPLVQNKGVSCKIQTADVESQTDQSFPRMMIVPVPVPVFVPVPMSMYSQYTPRPVGLPLPVPVPILLPVTTNNAERIIDTIKEIKEKIPSDPFEAELILMAEMVAEQTEASNKDEKPKAKVVEKKTERHEAPAPDDHTSNYSDDLDTDELASFLNNWEDNSSDAGIRSPSRLYTQEKLNPMVDVPVGLHNEPYSEPTPPAPPPMDIEADFTVDTLERMALLRERSQQTPSPPPTASRRRQAPRKAREKRGRKWQRSSKATEESSPKGSSKKSVALETPKLQSQYGVDAWKRWIQWRQTQPNLAKPRVGSRPMELKEDLLKCTTAELSYGLCCFISEVKRPNGEPYSPDSLFYLCLGIQQYLFENGRVENVFTDRFYQKFSTEFTSLLKGFKPSITASGYVHSRVEEEFLWNCKQLGAYSPTVLLNTLLYFCCKLFGFTTVEQHRQLSFAHVMRCTKTNLDSTKTTFLRFYPPLSTNETDSDPEVPAKRRKEDEGSKEDILEMVENTENPLRCPVRLYEFYLSKCSESVKQRTNVFYLLPERCCVPNSPLWFSSTALDDSTMDAMLTRILTVRELHLTTRKDRETKPNSTEDPAFIPNEEEEDESE
ncbi:hypothetical protein JOB18_025701 [Solea senegalensis]|uniref:TRASH domain-containing protein n=2 Tax=Solea senegalensis TaxID=28829 RepID=A0AAV6R9P2_SOLSE|nr:zinc finger MYM-type protein 4 isoform X1 [Solea senegalensis]KAG7500671.1 hypothetical protein JOB18_025701 [Solea senegalensis]